MQQHSSRREKKEWREVNIKTEVKDVRGSKWATLMPRLPLGVCRFHSPRVHCMGQSRPPDLNLLTLSTQLKEEGASQVQHKLECHIGISASQYSSFHFIFFFKLKEHWEGQSVSFPGCELRTVAQTSVGLQIGPDPLKPGGNKRCPSFNNFWQKCFKRCGWPWATAPKLQAT